MKKQILLNGITNDIAPTLLAGYYKYGVATLITGNFGTSGGGNRMPLILIEDEREKHGRQEYENLASK